MSTDVKKLHAVSAIVIGVSTGGVKALKFLFAALAKDFPLPILVVSHILPEADNGLALLLDSFSSLTVKEADHGELLKPGTVYLAPANYHMLVDNERRIALSVDPHVNFARPSVDVLFESAALEFGDELIGIELTGAGSDGSRGMAMILQHGGITIVQDPLDAEMNCMPVSTLQLITPDFVCLLRDMPDLLQRLIKGDSWKQQP
jgi:two-component system chemotaxis response regulator CheB